MARVCSFALFGACVLSASVARAQAPVLIAASDPTQITQVEVAKVTAANAPFWLSVELAAHAKIGVVTAADSMQTAIAADAWLRAIDFSTRVRVTPPAGPLAACADLTGQPADSGFPELAALAPSSVSSPASELELQRALADAGLSTDPSSVTDFSAHVAAPFRLAVYEAAASAGSTIAVRLTDVGSALSIPGIAVSGRDSVPITFVALAPSAVLPASGVLADPSDFAISYLGATASTDYTQARAAWLNQDPTRWLLETRASSGLFAWTQVTSAGEVEPAVSRYFSAASSQNGAACAVSAQAARAKSSQNIADFECGAADDLGSSLSALDFQDTRLTRLFGSIDAAGVALQSSDQAELVAPVTATDFDAKDCATTPVTPVPSTANGSGSMSPPISGGVARVGGAATSDGSTTTVADGSSGNVTVVTDSCSGDSSSTDGSGDSCGSHGTTSGSNDSCSGDSASDSSTNDSCSGDSSSSSDSDDSSGCGKSNYDGDTCTGNSASSASSEGKSTAALAPSQSSSVHGRRRVHLSLLTLLGALVALPLRRKKLLAPL